MNDRNALLVGGWLQGAGIGALLALVAPIGDPPALYAVAALALVAVLGGYYLERTAR